MEGAFNMIKNYGARLHKSYEDTFYMDTSKTTPSKRKGLVKRPDESPMIRPNDPKNLMQEYFNSVRNKRDIFKNDTT
mgnify:CR=1 FL=1